MSFPDAPASQPPAALPLGGAPAPEPSGRLLEAVLDATDSLVVVLAPDGRIRWFNRACERATGYTCDEVRGRSLWEHLLPPEEAKDVRAVFEQLAAGRFPSRYENDWLARDGRRLRIAWSNTAVLDPAGRVEYVVGSGTDVTAERRAAAALAVAEARNRCIVEMAGEGIWLIDPTGRTMFANRRMAELLGTTVEELTGAPVCQFVPPERKREALDRLANRLRGRGDQGDFVYRRKDGSLLYALTSAAPVLGPDGTVIAALDMVIDIGDRKRAEERQARLVAELDHRVKNALATVVALAEESLDRAATVAEVEETFLARVRAMARAHEVLSRRSWDAPDVDELVRTVLEPWSSSYGERMRLVGDSLPIPPRVAQPLALALQELATNARKHGALNGGAGTVELRWAKEDGALVVRWTERRRDVPGEVGPTARCAGGGQAILDALVRDQLEGDASFEIRPLGAEIRLRIPLATGPSRPAAPAASTAA